MPFALLCVKEVQHKCTYKFFFAVHSNLDSIGLILCMFENRSHQVTSTIKAVPEEEGEMSTDVSKEGERMTFHRKKEKQS